MDGSGCPPSPSSFAILLRQGFGGPWASADLGLRRTLDYGGWTVPVMEVGKPTALQHARTSRLTAFPQKTTAAPTQSRAHCERPYGTVDILAGVSTLSTVSTGKLVGGGIPGETCVLEQGAGECKVGEVGWAQMRPGWHQRMPSVRRPRAAVGQGSGRCCCCVPRHPALLEGHPFSEYILWIRFEVLRVFSLVITPLCVQIRGGIR